MFTEGNNICTIINQLIEVRTCIVVSSTIPTCNNKLVDRCRPYIVICILLGCR